MKLQKLTTEDTENKNLRFLKSSVNSELASSLFSVNSVVNFLQNVRRRKEDLKCNIST